MVQGEVGAEGRVVPVAQYIAATTLIAQGYIGKECPAQLAVNGHITAPKGFGIVEGVGIVHMAIGMYQGFVLILGEERLLAVQLAVARTQSDDAVVAHGISHVGLEGKSLQAHVGLFHPAEYQVGVAAVHGQMAHSQSVHPVALGHKGTQAATALCQRVKHFLVLLAHGFPLALSLQVKSGRVNAHPLLCGRHNLCPSYLCKEKAS